MQWEEQKEARAAGGSTGTRGRGRKGDLPRVWPWAAPGPGLHLALSWSGESGLRRAGGWRPALVAKVTHVAEHAKQVLQGKGKS